jgi:DNA helicase II / ATP-dependent DNA helicase PcrA
MISEQLNDFQRKAVEFNGKHLLVLAGAGTGKTHTIVCRAAHLISKGVLGKRIQILSFTRKSSSEIVERVNSMFRDNNDARQLNGSTFHAWCMNIIKKNPKVFKVSDYTVIDKEDQLGIFKLICGRNPKVIEETRLNAKTLLDIYSFARNTKKNLTESVRQKCLNNSNDERANAALEKIKPYLSSVFSTYESKKRERKYLDYDDILNVVSIGLKNNKDARDYITSQYDHILVDEMQDTNPLQWELLSSFQDNCHLFCVGDDAQSIYAFRGADFSNVHQFKDRVPDSEIFRLEDNYRSTQEILDLSNWLLLQSPLNYNKKLRAIRGAGELPVIMNFENEWREAEWVASEIVKNYTSSGLEYKEHLILVRSAFSGRTIEHFLLEKKIPYILLGGVGLLASAHIRDVASALRVIANIYDEIAWMRYLQLWESIGDVTASKLINEILELSSIDECIQLLEGKNLRNHNLISTLSAIKDMNNNPSDAISSALELMESRLALIYKEDWERKRKSDFQIFKKLAEKHGSIGDFIAEYVLDPQITESYNRATQSKDVVTISTIHSAKGLEAKICYVINVSVGAYPSSRTLDEGADSIEEERRVLYVALTRAKDKLFITRLIGNMQNFDFETGVVNDTQRIDGTLNNETAEKESPIMYFFDELPPELIINEISEQSKSDFSSNRFTGIPIDEMDFGMDMN